jgi:tocopherol O-methyltransferase
LFTAQDIAAYYEQSHAHYVQHWQLNRYLAMHYGLWWPETRHFGEALSNTHRMMQAWAQVKADEQVLDAGCGIGGSALWLGQETGSSVVGLSLSTRQIEQAKQLALARQLSDTVSFEVGDFCATRFPAASFDVVWAIESVCHAPEKAAFLREAYRLLRPGGRLVLCDFFRSSQPATVADARVLRQWLDAWAIDSLTTQRQFLQNAREVGFLDLHARDLTEAVTPSARRLYQRYRLGFPVQKLYEWLGNPTQVQRRSVRSARWQWEALQAGLWHYAMVAGRKT